MNKDKEGQVKYKNYDYLTYDGWLDMFSSCDLALIEAISYHQAPDNSADMAVIKQRADELIRLYPENRAILEGYVSSPLNEYDDLENSIVGVTWMLRMP